MKQVKSLIAAMCLFTGFAAVADVDYGIWSGVPAAIENADIEGVRFGLPVAVGNGTVEGAELSIFLSGTSHVEGFKFILIGANYGKSLEGGSLGFANIATEKLEGIQIGTVNSSGKGGIQIGFLNNCDNDATFQLGLININTNGWLPVMIFFNVGSEVFGD